MLAVPRQDTKIAKDALQALGMLDRARKAEQMAGGSCIALPLTREAASQLQALAPASTPTEGSQQSIHSQPDVMHTTGSSNSEIKPPSVVPDGLSAVRNNSTAEAGSVEAGSFVTAIGHNDRHAANGSHKPIAGDANSASAAELHTADVSRGSQADAGGENGRHMPAAPVDEAARGILGVLLGLLRSGVAQLEWRELLASRRAGGPSPAAKLRAGMQQLLSAHGKLPCSH